MGVLQALSAPRREPRVGTVVSVAGPVATVDVGGTEVDAQIPTVPAFTLATDDTVFVLLIGEGTWLVIAAL
jgi:hypothetical protein